MKKWIAAALLLTAACGRDPTPTPPPLPDSGEIAPGTTYSLAALVTAIAPAGVEITWSIEPGGGTVDQTGLYTAPGCAELLAAAGPLAPDAGQIVGTEHVTASWSGGGTVIVITIREPVLSVDVTPSSIEVEVGATTQFHAIVHYACHDQTI